MATSLASLVVSLEANIAKFSTDMKSAADVTQKTMSGITSAVSSAKSAFIGLAAAYVSVGAVAQTIKGAISLGDELKQMSDTTGIAIDKLDKLSIIAKLNGANLETMAVGFKGLNKALIESGDPASKSAQLFKALNISIKDSTGSLRGVDEVMADVAKALSGIENETTRAAVGTALFGKGYLAMAATLRNYSADQEAANRLLEKFGGVSTTAANLADELGDKFTLLGEGSKRAFLAGLVPGMAAVSAGLDTLIDKGGAAKTGFGLLVSWLAETATKTFVVLATEVQRLALIITAAYQAISTQSLDPLKAFAAQNQKLEAEFSATMARIKTAAKFPGLDDNDQISRAAGAQDRLADAAAKAAIKAKNLNAILADAKPSEYAKAMESLTKAVAGADAELLALTAQSKDLVPLQKALAEFQASDLWKKATQQFKDEYEALAKVGIAAQQTAKDFKELADKSADFASNRAKEYDEWVKQQSEVIAHTHELVKNYSEQNDALEAEISILGESEVAHKRLAAQLQYEAERRKIVAATTLDNVDAMGVELAKLEEQYARRQQLIGVGALKDQLREATAFVSDFFVDLFNNGLKSFKNLWESFKQLAFRALADVAAKQLIISLTGAVGAGASGAANAATGAGGLGGILQGLTSAFTGGFGAGGGLLGAAGGFGAAQTVALDSTLITSGLSQLAGGTLTQILGPALAVVPWAGLAAIAIPMIAKFFDKGPASRTGTFSSGNLGSDASRDAAFTGSSAFGQFGFSRDKWLNPADAGAGQAFQQMAQSITQLDNVIAGLVGKDITKEITDALAEHSITVGLGKEHTDINASGGPAEILKDRYVTILATIDSKLGELAQGFEGTGEELANFVVGILALRQQLGDTFDKLSASDVTALGDAFGGIDKLASSLAFLKANFETAADSIAASQDSLVSAFKDLGLAVPATHQAFKDLLSSFDLTTDSGRELYASVLNLSGAFVQVNGTATAAAAALRQSFASLDSAVADFRGISQGDQQSSQLQSLIGTLITSTGNAIFPQLLQQLGSVGFAQNLSDISHDDFSKYSTDTQSLITQIIALAAQVKGSAQGSVQSISGSEAYFNVFGGKPPAGTAADDAAAKVKEMLDLFSNIAGQTTGNYGRELQLQIQLVTGAMADAARKKMPEVVALLRASNNDFGASLRLFNSLSERYTDDIAEQLVKLTTAYNDQVKQLQGNASGLDALHQVFEEQWQAIINGTEAGVDGTLEALTRLQRGILDYVDSLKISADSPLTAQQKLAEAQRQYESTLAAAGTGDQAALGNVTSTADAYIKLAREFYASSQTYTDLFNQVTGDLTALGTQDFGAGTGAALNAADTALLAALPVGAKLMSALDLQNAVTFVSGANPTPTDLTATIQNAVLATGNTKTTATPEETAERTAEAIIVAIYESTKIIARASADGSDKVSDKLDQTRTALVEALTVGSK